MILARSLAPTPSLSPAMERHRPPPKRRVHDLVLTAFARMLPIAPQTTDFDSVVIPAGSPRRDCGPSPAPSRSEAEAKFGEKVAAWEVTGRPRSLRRRRYGRESEEVRKSQVPFFSISLDGCEIEEDFLAMTGSRQPRRPKKRPKYVEKKLEVIFPGLWLSEMTAELYEVYINGV